MENDAKFKHLKFNDFKRMAQDNNLSNTEKIGFPSKYRDGYEYSILESIVRKTDWCNKKHILDIGIGCSELSSLIISRSHQTSSYLHIIDSDEVICELDRYMRKISVSIFYRDFINNNIERHRGKFPDDFDLLSFSKMDIIICYSVLQHVFYEYELLGCSKILDFIEAACSLLNDNGKLLIGDIPNKDKARRFYKDKFIESENKEISDVEINAIFEKFRTLGYNVYILPQEISLPFYNRREDIVIEKV